MSERWRSTTILSVRKGGKVVVAGDGQVTLGATVMKSNARKVRRLGKGGEGIAGGGRDGRCLRVVRAAGSQTGAAPRQSRARLCGIGEGLAHGQIPPPSRS